MVYYKYAINKAKACYVGQDSSVGTASRYGLNDSGIESRWSEVSAPVQPYTRAHPAFYTIGKGLSPGVKRPRRGFCHPPPLLCRGLTQSRIIPLLLGAFTACSRMNFILSNDQMQRNSNTFHLNAHFKLLHEIQTRFICQRLKKW
jgi:hypothetical protein